jgi:hypothetical protein
MAIGPDVHGTNCLDHAFLCTYWLIRTESSKNLLKQFPSIYSLKNTQFQNFFDDGLG